MVTGQTCLVGKKCNDLKTDMGDFQLDEWESTYSPNKELSSSMELCAQRPFRSWFETVFGELDCPFVTYFGMFSVRKQDILKRPKSFYETLQKYVQTPHPEAGHYIERSWGVIFPSNPEFIML
jgi:hypothetical protein